MSKTSRRLHFNRLVITDGVPPIRPIEREREKALKTIIKSLNALLIVGGAVPAPAVVPLVLPRLPRRGSGRLDRRLGPVGREWVLGRRMDTDRMRARHYGLLGWSLARVFNTAQAAFNLTFETSEVEGVLRHDPDPEGPLLVFSRHAGAGDSLILVHTLSEAGRRPRIVLKESLQWDPLLDVILNRLPTVFAGSGPGRLGVA